MRDEENGKIKFFSRRMQHFPFFPSKRPPSARPDNFFQGPVCLQADPVVTRARKRAAGASLGSPRKSFLFGIAQA